MLLKPLLGIIPLAQPTSPSSGNLELNKEKASDESCAHGKTFPWLSALLRLQIF